MLNLNPVRYDYEAYICRRCLNEEYGSRLLPDDCHYGYVAECPCCGELRSIVVGLKRRGHVKMWFKD